jgi:hypothetical protein
MAHTAFGALVLRQATLHRSAPDRQALGLALSLFSLSFGTGLQRAPHPRAWTAIPFPSIRLRKESGLTDAEPRGAGTADGSTAN